MKRIILNVFLILILSGCQSNIDGGVSSDYQPSAYTELELGNNYLINNDPSKRGLQINNEGKLQDFVVDSESCGTPIYIQKMIWNGNSCEWEKLEFMLDYGIPIKIITDSYGNYFILYPESLIVYSPSGEEISRINVEADYDSKIYVEDRNVYLLLPGNKVQVYSYLNEILNDEYVLNGLENIIYFDKYILSKNGSKMLVSDINGNKINEISLPDEKPVYKFNNEYGDYFMYNKELAFEKDGVIYYTCMGGIYASEISGDKFDLLIASESTKYLKGETSFLSMTMDSDGNIYLSYDTIMNGTGVTKYALK